MIFACGDQGVGAYTMHRQIVSQIIGVEPERVHIETGDTGSAPYYEDIKGARGAHVEGRAVAQASTALVEALCSAAATHWRTGIEMSHGLGEERFLSKAKQV